MQAQVLRKRIRRHHALELSQDGGGAEGELVDRATKLATSSAEATPFEARQVSNDPEFENKAVVIGLSMKPSQYAAMFCVDEKGAI